MSEAELSIQNLRPPPDELLEVLAEYVSDDHFQPSTLALKTAQMALLDSLGCAFLALKDPLCTALLGPYVPGTKVPMGARVPGTGFELDPIKAAFDIGSCIRWLDYNDTWLAKEWGHPSDNLGCILALSDFLSRASKNNPMTLYDVWIAMIKAYEIQGILALENAFNQVGLDHVLLVKIASTAVAAKLFGLSKSHIIDALSHAFVDGASLRTYRHAPNTGPRKSWAAGDATARGLEMAWFVLRGQPGIPGAISTKKWGFSDVLFRERPILLTQPLQCYVMENILFKVSFPAEFHAQTAVEAAIQLHPKIVDTLEHITKIEIQTQEAGFRIINKEGPLYNYADRDHSLQYMVAIGLLHGNLKKEHYSDALANDPRIETLRAKMWVKENPSFSRDYLDPSLRAIPNSVQILFDDGRTEFAEIAFPLGHPRRRQEALVHLKEKYYAAVLSTFTQERAEVLCRLWDTMDEYSEKPCCEFINLTL